MYVKVWLGGDGPSEIGDRDKDGGARAGALEALLRRVEPDGWRVEGATQWRFIRKFRVGAAVGNDTHGDIRNVAGLVLQAYEAACEVVAFARDVDADRERAAVVVRAIDYARDLFPDIEIIGGSASPALEGWILALLGVRDTEAMSRARCNQLLDERDLGGKHAAAYVSVVEIADLERLPPGCDALRTWLASARAVLGRAIRGE